MRVVMGMHVTLTGLSGFVGYTVLEADMRARGNQ